VVHRIGGVFATAGALKTRDQARQSARVLIADNTIARHVDMRIDRLD